MTSAQGDLTYELHPGWEQLPAGWEHGDVVSVDVDDADRVYVFNRSAHPVIVYDREGRFLGSWGEGVFDPPPRDHRHPRRDVWCADDKDHTVRRFTLEGRLQQTLGTPHRPSDTGYVDAAGQGLADHPARGGALQPAHAPLPGPHPRRRPLRLRRLRQRPGAPLLRRRWAAALLGEPGAGPGQLNLPHSVRVDQQGRVFVCDRENDRIQIFDATGALLGVWTDVIRPADLVLRDGLAYVGELATEAGSRSMAGLPVTESRPSQVTVRDLEGNELARFGSATRSPPPGSPPRTASPSTCGATSTSPRWPRRRWAAAGATGPATPP